MRPDVAQSRGAEESVAKGVRQRVAIAVPDRALGKREFNAAEDQFAPISEAMEVVSNPRTGHRPARSWQR
jgi:hypothetical protein